MIFNISYILGTSKYTVAHGHSYYRCNSNYFKLLSFSLQKMEGKHVLVLIDRKTSRKKKLYEDLVGENFPTSRVGFNFRSKLLLHSSRDEVIGEGVRFPEKYYTA